MKTVETAAGRLAIRRIRDDAEPIGPKSCWTRWSSPCTGNTLAKLSGGVQIPPLPWQPKRICATAVLYFGYRKQRRPWPVTPKTLAVSWRVSTIISAPSRKMIQRETMLPGSGYEPASVLRWRLPCRAASSSLCSAHRNAAWTVCRSGCPFIIDSVPVAPACPAVRTGIRCRSRQAGVACTDQPADADTPCSPAAANPFFLIHHSENPPHPFCASGPASVPCDQVVGVV